MCMPNELFICCWPRDPASWLQMQVQKFIETQQKTNKSLNRELRKSRGYRNPYFLRSTVESFKLREGGTCFAPEVGCGGSCMTDPCMSWGYCSPAACAALTQHRLYRGLICTQPTV